MADKLLDITFKTESAEGLEEYMAAQKVGYVLRKIGKTLTIYETLTKNGDEYTYTFESTFKNHKMVFKLGVPFVDKGVDGREMKTTFTEEEDKLVAMQENIKAGDVPCKTVREILPDGRLLATMTSIPTDTVCKRYYSVYKKK